jgi:hypothetical protein
VSERPRSGEKWRRRYYGKAARVETRTVVDRYLGGDVSYFPGRVTKWPPPDYQQRRCTLAEWKLWQQFAKEVP